MESRNRNINTYRTSRLIVGFEHECPFLAEIRSSAGAAERLLWRKQTLKLDEPTAKTTHKRHLAEIKNPRWYGAFTNIFFNNFYEAG